MQVGEQRVVSITYTLTDDEGVELESVGQGETLTYIHGLDQIIPGLEDELDGLEPGDSFDVTVPPEQGYGEHVEELVREVDRDVFPDDVDLEPDMVFQATTQGPNGEGQQLLRVDKVVGDKVVVDANPPLAGKTLNFEGEVANVRDATKQEVEEGKPRQQ